MKSRNQSISTYLFLIVLVIACMTTAQAQEVQVNSAKPSSAEQGTFDLDVEISGSGFDNSAAVDFFVTGTTNPGGITVKKVKVRGSKKIIATINVSDTAIVDDFDIEVSLSSGRGGKGTTLFAVQEKDTGGKPGKGNQPIDATAYFVSGDITSNMALQGEFIDNGGFDTVIGQLDPVLGEKLTVTGDAGEALAVLHSRHAILPDGASVYPTGCEATLDTDCFVDFNSGVSWNIRLDRDKQPPNRVQFKMRWVNGAGLEHHLRIGWVVQAYEDEKYPLDPVDYGKTRDGASSLLPAPGDLDPVVIDFNADNLAVGDLFRIDGNVPTGRGKKTELEVFSIYREQFDNDPPGGLETTPWCAMGGTNLGDFTCRALTTIHTNRAN